MVKKIKKINNQKRLADIKKKLRLSKLTKTNIATKSNPKLSKSTSSSQVAKKNNKILKNDTAKVINFKNKKKKLKSKSKLDFDDDTKIVSPIIYIKKVVYMMIVIIAFSYGKFGILDKTIQAGSKIEPDLVVKKDFLLSGPQTKANIEKKHEILKNEFKKIQNTFFIVNKSDEFYDFLTSNAIKHNVKIVSLNKVKEDFYKQPKKDKKVNLMCLKITSNLIYDLTLEANFVDFKNFINSLKVGNKSLATNTATVERKNQETVTINTRFTLNFISL